MAAWLSSWVAIDAEGSTACRRGALESTRGLLTFQASLAPYPWLHLVRNLVEQMPQCPAPVPWWGQCAVTRPARSVGCEGYVPETRLESALVGPGGAGGDDATWAARGKEERLRPTH